MNSINTTIQIERDSARMNMNNQSEETRDNKPNSSSGHNSIIYTKDGKKNGGNFIVNYIVNTIESFTSSEVKQGINFLNDTSFISQVNHGLDNLNVDDIKDSNI
jgi:hypothetical protein